MNGGGEIVFKDFVVKFIYSEFVRFFLMFSSFYINLILFLYIMVFI